MTPILESHEPTPLESNRALKAPITLPTIHWAQPTQDQLRDEFHEWEIQRLLDPRGYSPKDQTDKAFEFFCTNLTPTTLSFDSLDLENQFRFRFPDYPTLKRQVTSYGGPKDPDRIVAGIIAGHPIPMPVIVKTRSQRLILAGGATRISIAGLAQLPITALMFEEHRALLWKASHSLIEIKHFTQAHRLLPELSALLAKTPGQQSEDSQCEIPDLHAPSDRDTPKPLYLEILNIKLDKLRFELNRNPTLNEILAA